MMLKLGRWFILVRCFHPCALLVSWIIFIWWWQSGGGLLFSWFCLSPSLRAPDFATRSANSFPGISERGGILWLTDRLGLHGRWILLFSSRLWSSARSMSGGHPRALLAVTLTNLFPSRKQTICAYQEIECDHAFGVNDLSRSTLGAILGDLLLPQPLCVRAFLSWQTHSWH